jgi:hypothetical protein
VISGLRAFTGRAEVEALWPYAVHSGLSQWHVPLLGESLTDASCLPIRGILVHCLGLDTARLRRVLSEALLKAATQLTQTARRSLQESKSVLMRNSALAGFYPSTKNGIARLQRSPFPDRALLDTSVSKHTILRIQIQYLHPLRRA